MHELGIVMHVISQVEEVARENGGCQVLKVVMEVGEVSGVVPELFEDAFNWARKKTEFLKDAELEQVIIQGITYCTACGETYSTTEHGKTCPHCGSTDTYLLTGSEIKIRDLQVQDGAEED